MVTGEQEGMCNKPPISVHSNSVLVISLVLVCLLSLW